MMKTKEKSNMENNSGGVGFLGLLTIVFIVLKLVGIITWSWWAVLAPIWVPISMVIIVFALALLID